MTTKVKTASNPLMQQLKASVATVSPKPLSAAVNPDAVTVEDVLAAMAEGKVDVAEYRTFYSVKYGKDTILDDEQIAEVIAENPDGFDSGDGWAEVMQEAEALIGTTDADVSKGSSPMAIATTNYATAVDFGHRLGDDFIAEVQTTVKNDIRKMRLPVHAGELLVTTYTLDTILNVFPTPGSKGKSGGNILYDKYVYGTDEETGDFYREMIEATPEGQKARAFLDKAKLAGKEETNQDKLPAELRGLVGDDMAIKELSAPYAKFLSTGAQLLRRAVGYLQTFHTIKGQFNTIGLKLIMTPKIVNGKRSMSPSEGPTPFQAINLAETDGNYKPKKMSADQLARLFVGNYPKTETPKLEHIRHLIANEGKSEWDAVMGAITRAKKGTAESGTEAGALKVPAFNSDDMARQGVAETNAWFIDPNTGNAIPKRRAALVAWLQAKDDPDDRKHRVLTMGNACLFYDEMWNSIEKEFRQYQAEEGAAEAAEAAIKSGNQARIKNLVEKQVQKKGGFPQSTAKAS